MADNPGMLNRHALITFLIAFALTACVVTAWAAKEFVPPRPENANTYPLKDAHPNEKVTAAIELYNTAPKNNIFVTPYAEEGILPVFLIVSNDGDQPITLSDLHAELVTTGRTKLSALSSDDVFRRVSHISASSTSPGRVGPLPFPNKSKNKKAQQEFNEINNAIFAAEAVEPHTTKSGFLFFDVLNVTQPTEGAHLYLTGIRDAGGNDLMYFDIAVTPSSQPAQGQ